MFGEEGLKAVEREMMQLHIQKVMSPRQKHDLTNDEIKRCFNYLMFLKQKQSGDVKGRKCANGQKQRLWTRPKDATLPTAAQESVFITSAIDAKEGREVAVSNLPGAFMQTDMDNKIVHIKFQGAMADLLIKIAPKVYGPYAIVENGQTTIYVQLLKALYGTLQAARMFYEKLVAHLQGNGFVLNP